MLVQTLTNAIEQNRIPHAFMLTGIRGVGKTSTARIIAKCLNNTDGMSPTPEANCKQCLAIEESRHPDVLEMDAASRTGVGDIREIIDSVQYAPTMGHYKVYIIDEVHMLSKNAFNGPTQDTRRTAKALCVYFCNHRNSQSTHHHPFTLHAF